MNTKKVNETPVGYGDGVVYYLKFPNWVREKYYNTIQGKCQLCEKNILLSEMEIHRVKRGFEGGLYTLCKLNHKEQNCKFLCNSCHKLVHSKEFS
jgi:5-methylcytosine-specific restriction endonuclease McrA